MRGNSTFAWPFAFDFSQGEFDAMAVYQATNIPAVSLPNGASSLPLEVLPLLERFDKIYLWMDHDGPGQAGVDKFIQKLVREWAFSASHFPRF